jgi:hypothetical protein
MQRRMFTKIPIWTQEEMQNEINKFNLFARYHDFPSYGGSILSEGSIFSGPEKQQVDRGLKGGERTT